MNFSHGTAAQFLPQLLNTLGVELISINGVVSENVGARSFEDLPKAAKAYVKTIEELAGAPVSAIGVGPRRDQTLQLRPLL